MSAPSLQRFVEALRAGGMKIGSDALLQANAALAAVGLASLQDVRAALQATLVRDPADLPLFAHVFAAYFSRRSLGPPDTQLALPRSRGLEAAPGTRRFAASLAGPFAPASEAKQEDAAAEGTSSPLERLASKDFEQMSAPEFAEARNLLASVRIAALRRSRRWSAGVPRGSIDLKTMLRRSPATLAPQYRNRVRRPRDLVLLVDVSGSMAAYSRMFLHLARVLARTARTETFVFATRLTRVTRELAAADPDVAMRAVSHAVEDWDSGTRIGACLATFHREWGRRVMTRSPRVVLFTDGLEVADVAELDREAARLARGGHELVWLNPLLRSPTYQALAAGAAVLTAHATRMAPAHNVDSLRDLAARLG